MLSIMTIKAAYEVTIVISELFVLVLTVGRKTYISFFSPQGLFSDVYYPTVLDACSGDKINR